MQNLTICSILFALCFISCSKKVVPTAPSPQLQPVTIGTPSNCPIEQPNWNSVEVGISSEQKVELLTSLLTTFKADNSNTKTQDILNAQGGLTAEFTNSFNQTINSLESRSYKISQDVQDLIVSARNLACDIHAGIYSGDNRNKAELKLLDIRSEILQLKKKAESR